MQNSTNVEVVVTAKDEASKKLQTFSDKLVSIKSIFKKTAIASTVALGAIVTGLVASVSAAAEAEAGQAQLAAVLKSTSGVAGVTADMANKLASELSQLSTFTDDAILGVQNLLLTSTKIGSEVFPEATRAILDLSVAMGQDLKSSTIQVAKALQDPIQGIGALRKLNIVFTESQEAMMKKFVESGDIMSAQKIILKELATEFGGSALANAKSLSGVIKILTNNIGEAQEGIGNAFLPIVKKLGTSINETVLKVNKWIEANPNLIRGIITAVAVVAGLVAGLGFLGLAFIAASAAAALLGTTVYAMLGPIGWVIGAIALLGVGSGYAAYKMNVQKGATDELGGASNELNKNMKNLSNGIEGSGKKADETAKKLKELKKQMLEIVAEGAKQEANSRKGIAELFIEQEQKVADISGEINEKSIELRKAKRDKESVDRMNTISEEIGQLNGKLFREQEAITISKMYLVGLDKEYAEAKRRSLLTEFQKKLEDILAEQKANKEATEKKIKAKQEEINALIKEEKRYTSTVIEENAKKIESHNQVSLAAIRAATRGNSGSTGSWGSSSVVPSGMSFAGYRAQGGNAMGGSTYMVGERGPELFTPSRNGSVIPNNSLKGGQSFVVNILGGTYLSREVANEIGDMIIENLKQVVRI